MYDKHGKLLRLAAQQVANEAHGHICVCGATAFRVTQIAISRLWGQEVPTKGQLKVIYHHPGKGHKDVFKYLLGPENVTYKKVGDPRHLTLAQHYTYLFVRKDTGATWKTQMKEGVIPKGFFDLRYKVKGFLIGWHKKKPYSGHGAIRHIRVRVTAVAKTPALHSQKEAMEILRHHTALRLASSC